MIIYFLDFLILRFLSMAIKLPSILLGYYVAIQAQNYDLAFISCMNHAVLAFIQADILTYLGIATLILQKQGTKGCPDTSSSSESTPTPCGPIPQNMA